MKKLLLSIGTVVAVAAPIASVVSCGTKDPVKSNGSGITYAYAKVNELNDLDAIKDYSIGILMPLPVNPRPEMGYRGMKLFLKGYTHYQADFLEATSRVASAGSVDVAKHYLEKTLEAYEAIENANRIMTEENAKSLATGVVETEKD